MPAARMGSERARQLMAEMRKDHIPMSSTPTRIVIDPQTLRPIISVTPAFEECIEQSLMSML